MYGRSNGQCKKVVYGQRTRKVVKGKRSNRRSVNTAVNTQRAKWLQPIRSTMRLKFAYVDTGYSVALNAGNGYWNTYVFKGNDIFDPDFTGVGVQPYGYDEMMSASMFTRFNVPASSIKVFFRPAEPLRRLHAIVIPWGASSVTANDIADIRMIPYHRETTYDSVTESTKGAVIGNYSKTTQVFSEMNNKDTSFSGTYSASPSYLWYWIIIFTSDEAVETDIYFDVKLKYYTKVSRSSGQPNES